MKVKKLVAIFAALISFSSALFAQKISVKQDEGGWKIYDGNKAVEIKGVVWAFTPIGETFNYSLFAQSDSFIQRMIDTDMPMLKAMGVNTIRCFTTIPPKWVEYIYTKYGIYTMVNDLLGRYGVSVNGVWYPQTDYSDYYTRETLIEQARQTALAYKDCKGVIMYMFGNESNYGLVWSSTEIEDLPVGDQNMVKAAYLYDLLEKAMAVCKEIDPERPVGIVNGDVGNLDLIAKLCPTLDVLGVNVYRGYKAYDSLYENVRDTLNKPIVFTEFGADAYNDILKQEDQNAQLTYMKSQWQEIYEQSYGKGKCQNILGGYVFEWIDEWWKRYQTKNLTEHDDASWGNAGYDIDYREGVNNMSEEWFGLCAQSQIKEDGINVRIPRAAYYMLQDVWKLPLYDSTNQDIAKKFASLNDGLYIAKGNEKTIKQEIKERHFAKISQAEATVNSTTPVYVNGVAEDIMKGTRNWASDFRYKNAKGDINQPTTAVEGLLGVEFNPFEGFTGEVVFKAWTAEKFTRIGDRWPVYYETSGKYIGDHTDPESWKLKHADVYSASFNYTNPSFDINGYYHVGHASFEGKGDPFSISKEGFDLIGYETYGSKAPIALEFVGHGALQGLEVIGGPEIVGGAMPMIQANYFKWIPSVGPLDGIVLNATGSAAFGSSENLNFDPYAGYGGGYKASVYGETYIMPWFQLKGGALLAGTEKIGAFYITDEREIAKVNLLDTLGGYAQIGTNMFQYLYIYSNVIYRGIVADTNAAIPRWSYYTADSGSGNRFEVQVGADITFGDMVFKPVIRARTPLQKPMGRSLLAGSPFAVGLGNRQSVEVEAVFCYDPEGGTWFHEWNSNDIEGAPWAFSVTGLYQLFAGKTDNLVYKSNTWATYPRNDGTTAYQMIWYEGGALGFQDNLFQIGTRWVFNPPAVPGLRLIANATVGRLSASTGAWTDNLEYVTFYNAGLAARYGHFIGSLDATINGWGPEGWWRYFNNTFPLQYTLDVAYSFKENPSFMEAKNRVGLKLVGRVFDEHSSDAYNALPMGAAIDGAHYFELTTYFNIGL